MLKKILTGVLIALGVLILLFAGFLAYSTWRDYRPHPREILYLESQGQGSPIPVDKKLFTALTWNIGYGGLGAETDFFFDGGRMVRPSEEAVRRYTNNIVRFLANTDSVDFIFLQEVDVDSRRSYHINQVKEIREGLPQFVYAFAKNYDSWFVPQPITAPYGKVKAGLLSLSPYMPALATRIALAPDASWPTGLFMLDRCLLEWRYPLANGRELVVYNLHLSAYDDGSVKQRQMDTLRRILQKEYEKGNFVVAGGDWNQSPPGYEPAKRNPHLPPVQSVPEVFPAQGWQWAFQVGVPTNRSLDTPYKRGETPVTIIDFFLVSPNVEIAEVKGVDLDFQDSDHQPVILRFRLKGLTHKDDNIDAETAP
jgi:endonuclease/exonuclease/phosphatase family metal-dependent hydrolase